MEQVSLYPILTYRAARLDTESPGEAPLVRFFGSLEAIKHDRAMSLRGGDLTVAADMAHSQIFVMPPDTGNLPDESPLRTNWDRLGSVTEGTRVFVSGSLLRRGTEVTIGGQPGSPMLVVIYDGVERNLLRRAIWSGRQLNEYWNQLTPAALACGMLALIILSYALLRVPSQRLAAITSLTLASLPFLPLLPPGVALFYIYRRLWRRGRILRAHRDVLLLPLRHLNGPGLPDESYVEQSCTHPEAMRYVAAGAYIANPPIQTPEDAFSVFGRPAPDGIEVPDDPMSEIVVIPGNPTELSRRCQKLAQRFEWLSVAVLGVGLTANVAVAFLVLLYLVR